MEKYEYKVLRFSSLSLEREIEEELNSFAKKGWRKIHSVYSDNLRQIIVFLERRIENEH